jgi:hypothetical protein
MFGLSVHHVWRPKRGTTSLAEKDFLRQLKSMFSALRSAVAEFCEC